MSRLSYSELRDGMDGREDHTNAVGDDAEGSPSLSNRGNKQNTEGGTPGGEDTRKTESGPKHAEAEIVMDSYALMGVTRDAPREDDDNEDGRNPGGPQACPGKASPRRGNSPSSSSSSSSSRSRKSGKRKKRKRSSPSPPPPPSPTLGVPTAPPTPTENGTVSKAPPGVAPTATAAATLNEAVGKASSPPPGTNDPGMNCAEDSETVVSVDGGPEIIAVDDNDEDVGIIVERVVRRGGETAAGAGDDGGKTGEPEEELTIIVGKDAEDEVKAIARERLSSWAMKFTAQRAYAPAPPPKLSPMNDEFLVGFGRAFNERMKSTEPRGKRGKKRRRESGGDAEPDGKSRENTAEEGDGEDEDDDEDDEEGEDELEVGSSSGSEFGGGAGGPGGFESDMSLSDTEGGRRGSGGSSGGKGQQKFGVFVTNVPYSIWTTSGLTKHFSQYDTVTCVDKEIKSKDGRIRNGIACIFFRTAKGMEAAVQDDGKIVEGRSVGIRKHWTSSGAPSGKARYFIPAEARASKTPGEQSPYSAIRCQLCGAERHNHERCPNSACLTCYTVGHLSEFCPIDERTVKPKIPLCILCGAAGHDSSGCKEPSDGSAQDGFRCINCASMGHMICSGQMKIIYGNEQGVYSSCCNCGRVHEGSEEACSEPKQGELLERIKRRNNGRRYSTGSFGNRIQPSTNVFQGRKARTPEPKTGSTWPPRTFDSPPDRWQGSGPALPLAAGYVHSYLASPPALGVASPGNGVAGGIGMSVVGTPGVQRSLSLPASPSQNIPHSPPVVATPGSSSVHHVHGGVAHQGLARSASTPQAWVSPNTGSTPGALPSTPQSRPYHVGGGRSSDGGSASGGSGRDRNRDRDRNHDRDRDRNRDRNHDRNHDRDRNRDRDHDHRGARRHSADYASLSQSPRDSFWSGSKRGRANDNTWYSPGGDRSGGGGSGRSGRYGSYGDYRY